MSSPVVGGRPLLRGRVLGFPIHVDLSFILIMAFLGYYREVTLTFMALWLLITPIAVLVHELGHAVTARAAGAHPQIALAGFGGVTTFVPPQPLSRLRSLGISLAGPAVGLVLGVAVYVIRGALINDLDPFGWQLTALDIGVWTCIGWSVLNLLPILPLDGGQAMRELLPGSPEVRSRRAAVVSIVAAVAAAGVAFALNQPYLALFMAFFGLSNVLALRAEARGGRPNAASVDGAAAASGTPEQIVAGLLWQGEAPRARQFLEQLPEGTPVDLAAHGAVLALTGDPEQGHALLTQEVQRRPEDPNAAALLIITLGLQHDWDGVVRALQSPAGAVAPRAVIDRVITEARGTGREDVAGRLTHLAAGSTP